MTEPRHSCHRALALLLALIAPAWACGDIVDSVNAVRHLGCESRPAAPPLHANARLDAAAHRLSQGEDLRSALQSAGYHEVSSFSVSISNVPPGGEVERTLAQQFCRQVTDPALREIGTWRNGDRVWIALAAPFNPPASRDQDRIAREVLALTNEARAKPRRCGSIGYGAAASLSANARLAEAALGYARDMARFGYMEHTGRDGSSPAERITRSGYRWREVGENLASGVMTPAEVVAGWLASPEHCANLMNPAYRETGVAFAVNPRDARGIYWAMELGTPR
jgi:uncharacterized protein YkwD